MKNLENVLKLLANYAGKAWKFVVLSSTDPEKFSASLKNFLALAVLLGVSQQDASALNNLAVQFLMGAGMAGTAAAGLVKTVRKIRLTYYGENKALK